MGLAIAIVWQRETMTSERKRDRSTGGSPPTKNQKDKPSGSTIYVFHIVKVLKTAAFNVNVFLDGYTLKCAGITNEEYNISLEDVPLT